MTTHPLHLARELVAIHEQAQGAHGVDWEAVERYSLISKVEIARAYVELAEAARKVWDPCGCSEATAGAPNADSCEWCAFDALMESAAQDQKKPLLQTVTADADDHHQRNHPLRLLGRVPPNHRRPHQGR